MLSSSTMVIKALSYFTSLLACINIISAIPLQPRILDIGQVNQHAERRSNFAQRAPQEVSELIEALPENDVPQDIVSTQYTDYEPQEFTIAGNLDGGFREKGTGSKQPPTTNGNIPLIPTRKHHPNVEPDFRNDVEHKKGGEGADTELTPEEQEEKESKFNLDLRIPSILSIFIYPSTT